MAVWTVEIETPDGVASDADVLERFAGCLDAALGRTGAAASVSAETGVLSATFTLAVSSAVSAADVGVEAFRSALVASALEPVEPARVTVERVGASAAVAL